MDDKSPIKFAFALHNFELKGTGIQRVAYKPSLWSKKCLIVSQEQNKLCAVTKCNFQFLLTWFAYKRQKIPYQ